ncbi:MAG: adenylyltransferase/cytidyltransferase family protein [Conexivisphaerales archaeon]
MFHISEQREAFIKRVLGFIFATSLQRNCKLQDIADSFYLSKGEAEQLISQLKDEGLIKMNDAITLTEDGRKRIKVVLTGGVFDIIHRGHIYTLSKAKELGDVLVVVVARDKIVQKLRGKPALNSEKDRAELVRSIRYVDAAVLGSEEDPLGAMYSVRPDVIAIGYDQKHDEREIETKANQNGMKVQVKRLDSPVPNMKSTDIKQKKEAMESF